MLFYLGRILILAALVTLAGAVLAVYPDSEGAGGNLWSGMGSEEESEDFGLEVVEGSGAKGSGEARVASVLASLGATWLGGSRTGRVAAVLLLLDAVAGAPILVVWPSAGTGKVTTEVWSPMATERVTTTPMATERVTTMPTSETTG